MKEDALEVRLKDLKRGHSHIASVEEVDHIDDRLFVVLRHDFDHGLLRDRRALARNLTVRHGTDAVGAVFGDDDASEQLSFAALALAGFNGPTTLARCEFRATGAAPAAGGCG